MGGLTTRARHIWRRVLHPELSAGLRTRILLALFEIRYPGPEIKYGRPRSGKGRPFNATRTLGTGGARIAKLICCRTEVCLSARKRA